MNLNCISRCNAGEPLSGSWEEFHEIFALWTLNLVGTARCAVRAALSGAMMPPAASRGGDIAVRCPYQSQVHGKRAPPKIGRELGHEPGRRLQSGTGFQPVSPEQAGCLCHFLRFMASLHGFVTAHWDDELERPLRRRRPRPRNRVGQSRRRTRTNGRFMESFHGFATTHLDHERWGETPSSPDLPATGIR